MRFYYFAQWYEISEQHKVGVERAEESGDRLYIYNCYFPVTSSTVSLSLQGSGSQPAAYLNHMGNVYKVPDAPKPYSDQLKFLHGTWVLVYLVFYSPLVILTCSQSLKTSALRDLWLDSSVSSLSRLGKSYLPLTVLFFIFTFNLSLFRSHLFPHTYFLSNQRMGQGFKYKSFLWEVILGNSSWGGGVR